MSDKPDLIEQEGLQPTRKVTAYAIGAALATIAVWLLSETVGVQPPPGVEGAMALIFGFCVAWWTRERDTPSNPET